METFNLFVDDLTVLDCAILDPQRGPIGMSWKVGIEFIGGLTSEGVVFDFSYAKKAAKKVIDGTADHALIIPRSSITECTQEHNVEVGNGQGYQVPAMMTIKCEQLVYSAPTQAFFILEQVTESSIIAELELLIFEACKENNQCASLKAVKLTFTNEQVVKPNSAYYCYTHGLKEHYGNCQRLIHGHQSTIEVFVNGVKSPELEKEVAAFYYDKHLAYWRNIDEEKSTKELTVIHYKSCQGEFTAKLDARTVILYPLETTVENISKYTAYWIKEQHPNLLKSSVTVKAFEGIGKGSIFVLSSKSGTVQELSLLWKDYDYRHLSGLDLSKTEKVEG